jgi:hypothetical protein
MSRDALEHATIKNNLTSPDEILYWRSVPPVLGKSTMGDEQVKEVLDKTLENTTVKRACCLGAGTNSLSVKVRIPLPKDYTDYANINKDFNFIDKAIQVPASMCKKVESADGPVDYVKPNKRNENYTKPCDDFYKVYCANMLAFYIDEFEENYPGKVINADKFAKEYKHECACFNLNSDFPPSTPLSSRCLQYPGCNDAYNDLGLVYLDPASRKTCPESVVLCQQIIDVSNTSAGGSITITPELQNQCGGQPGWPPASGTGGTGGGTGGTGGTGSTGKGGTGTGTGIDTIMESRMWFWLFVGFIVFLFLLSCSASSWYFRNRKTSTAS